jgi:hypothetical protein
MRFNLIFETSGDCIPFETKYNADLMAWFIDQANSNSYNKFSDDQIVYDTVDEKLTHCHWALSKTNEVLYDLIGQSFAQNTDLLDYLDQGFLNRQHRDWVFSQQELVNIDTLRFSTDNKMSALGWNLHDIYPDEIRNVKIAEILAHLGYKYPYEEVNMAVHRLEMFFAENIEFKSQAKWNVVDNPNYTDFVSNNDKVNFSFGYTYVGRQYYDKWKYWDTNLVEDDHYNYETLEWAFQINLDRPQTIPFSQEFLDWCKLQNVPTVSTQIPIGNIIDLENNLKTYRSLLYKNSKDNNSCFLKIV